MILSGPQRHVSLTWCLTHDANNAVYICNSHPSIHTNGLHTCKQVNSCCSQVCWRYRTGGYCTKNEFTSHYWLEFSTLELDSRPWNIQELMSYHFLLTVYDDQVSSHSHTGISTLSPVLLISGEVVTCSIEVLPVISTLPHSCLRDIIHNDHQNWHLVSHDLLTYCKYIPLLWLKQR